MQDLTAELQRRIGIRADQQAKLQGGSAASNKKQGTIPKPFPALCLVAQGTYSPWHSKGKVTQPTILANQAHAGTLSSSLLHDLPPTPVSNAEAP